MKNKTLILKLDELSFLARETNGAAFVIQHEKTTGKWKVVFNNSLNASKDILLYNDSFFVAIDNAIDWLKSTRKPLDIPLTYTLY